MTDRLNPEALASMADAIWIHVNDEYGICDADRQTTSYLVCQDMADKFIAAYLAALPAPRTITNKQGLVKLPDQSIVQDAGDAVVRKWHEDTWYAVGESQEWVNDDIMLPATVLHIPTEGGGE